MLARIWTGTLTLLVKIQNGIAALRTVLSFQVFVLFVGDFFVKMAPKHSEVYLYARMLSSVPKSKKVVMCLTEKIHVSDKLHSGMSSRVVEGEFSVNGPIMCVCVCVCV